jgi:endonuclease/exonuclease/phosphatase family metal-dependent hydrolase
MRRTHMLTILASMLIMIGEVFAANNSNQPIVSVMSFNIRYATARDGDNQWDKRKQLVLDVIRKDSSDIIGLQEALRSQLDEIRKAFPEYEEAGVGRNGGKKGEYSAILYNTKIFDSSESGTFWLSETPNKPSKSKSWGNACTRICTWIRLTNKKTGLSFYVYNTHLDHQSQPSREKSVRLIMSRIDKRKHNEAFILTGDFNAGENSPEIRYIKGLQPLQDRSPVSLVDTFRTLFPKEKTVGTFNGFRGRTGGAKIDYVFASPGVVTLEAAIIRTNSNGRYPSDHFPVTARVRFKPGKRLGEKKF